MGAAEVAPLAARGATVTGVPLALYSAAGVLGGPSCGGRRWPGSPARRPLVRAAVFCLGCAVPSLPHATPVVAGVMLLAGACAAVPLITGYGFVDRGVPERHRTGAGAWVNAAWNLGAAPGSAAGGLLVDDCGSWPVFAVVAGALSPPSCRRPPCRRGRTQSGPGTS